MRAVVLAGGRGVRMGELTRNHPKPMLPVGPLPLVGHQLWWLAGHGITEVVLATGYRAEAFDSLPQLARRWGLLVRLVVEPAPAGTGGGLRNALSQMGADASERVIVSNGDLLTGHDLQAQVAAAQEEPDQACVHVRQVPDARPYGRVELGSDRRIVDFSEKSATPGPAWVNAGTYVIQAGAVLSQPSTFESVERQLFPALARAGVLGAYPEPSATTYFRDVGTAQALLEASVDAVTGRLPWSPQAAEAYVHPAARIAPGAVITGGSAVHAGAVVEADAQVRGCVVLPGAVVAAGHHLDAQIVAPTPSGPG